MGAIKAAAACLLALLALQLGASWGGGAAAARQLDSPSQDSPSAQPPEGIATVAHNEAAPRPSTAPAAPIATPMPTPGGASASHAGLSAEALVQQLAGRGPCTQPVTCFVPPCSLPGACPAGKVCLSDYCGACKVFCAERAALCHAMLRIEPSASCSV